MQTIVRALTYNGSVLDTVLNAIVLIVLVAALLTQRRSPWWTALVVVVVVQIAVWFALGVVGFSLVWSGLAGVAAVDLLVRRGTSGRWMLRGALIIALAALLYYAVTVPPISTIAHLLAVAVGAGIHALALRAPRHLSARRVNHKVRPKHPTR